MPALLRVELLVLVALAAIYDWRLRKVPNWLNLSGAIVGIGLNTFFFAMHGLVSALLGLLLALAIYIPFHLLRAMGAGDAKLMAAVGAVAGPQNWLLILLYTMLAGGVMALAVAARSGRMRKTFTNTAVVAQDLLQLQSPARHPELDVRNPRSVRLPHAVSIAAGSLFFLAGMLSSAH